ncbi:MAG TPA: hypothetical protein VH414_04255 [Lichenihabitans sp.]|jgi:ornithine cyclodeaminase|nr:hypothetical protein [Lichenihabitans sp.]
MALPVIDTDALDIDPLRLVEALREGHRRGIDGFDRSYLAEPRPEGENGFLLWPAWRHGEALGAKLATIFPGNEKQGAGPNIRSLYLLFDGKTGAPLALMTGEAFTRHKTAADSALGTDLLARQDARHLLVLGAGAQVETHVAYLRAVRPSIDRVTLWNRTAAKADAIAARISGGASTEDRAGAVSEADIVTCLTAANEPVLEGAWLKPGTHVDLVGGFTPAMRECDDAAVLRARVFVDHRGLVMAHNGDIRDPLERGVIGPDHVRGDLFDLCSGRVAGRTDPAEITLFKNGGGGHLDLMAATTFHAMV